MDIPCHAMPVPVRIVSLGWAWCGDAAMLCDSGMEVDSLALPRSMGSMSCGSICPFTPTDLGGLASVGLWGVLAVTGGAE